MKFPKTVLTAVTTFALAGAAQAALICGTYTFDESLGFAGISGTLDFDIEKDDLGNGSGSYFFSNLLTTPIFGSPVAVPDFGDNIVSAEFDPFTWEVTSFVADPGAGLIFDFGSDTSTGVVGITIPGFNIPLTFALVGSQEVKAHDVSDSGNTVALLGLGLLAFAGFGKKFGKAA